MQSSRIRAGRVALAATAGMVMSLALAGAALAHAELDVEPAQAGATDALVTVFPEAHNHNAGVISVQVFPPESIPIDDISLVNGPAGWEMTTGEDSYTLAGDELEIDVSPRHQIEVRQLPDEPEIWFRILVNYRDGQVDRWIEIPTEDDPDPPNAAAGAQLAPADPAPTTPAATTPPAAPAPETTGPPSPAAAADEAGGDANPGLIIALVVAALLAAAAGVAVWLRRRGAAS